MRSELSSNNDIRRGVEEVYDSISPFFVKHREHVWPPTSTLLDEISPCTVADIGCGTGRLVAEAVTRGCYVKGMDISAGQLDTARTFLKEAGIEKDFELIKSDMEEIPLDDDSCGAVFLVASLHHLENRSSRINALKEAQRILKNDGIIQISVWSWDQDRFRERHLSRIEKRREIDDLDGPLPGDFMVPWKDGRKEMRFYHLYGPGEIEGEVRETDLRILRSFFDGRNHWLEAFKDRMV
jgi:ubiquinone/menaquinone biosynthesis C-methylase UbiE